MITLEMPRTEQATPPGVPLTEAPMFGRSRNMTRWHIPRTGVLYRDSHLVYATWCGGASLFPLSTKSPALMVDEITDEVPVCGPCVGRAQGSGHPIPVVEVTHPSGIVFEPRHLRVPRSCPGARYGKFEPHNVFVGRCHVCRDYLPIRYARGYATEQPHLRQHAPGPSLVDPCPWHGWDRITAEGLCSCGTPSIKAAA